VITPNLKERNYHMKKTLVSIFTVLVLILLLPVTTALAQAERTVLEGTEDMFIMRAPGCMWQADGWIQQRDVAFTGTFDFGAMKGTETQLVNAKLNPVTGEGRVWGVVTYSDSATGITCSGIREGKLTNFLLTAKIVASCSDGSLLKGTLQDIELIFPPGSPAPSEVISEFNGELLSR
jgi:hypothetical protein